MSLHKEVNFEIEICEHLAANCWLYEEGDAAKYDRAKALFPEDVLAGSRPPSPRPGMRSPGITVPTRPRPYCPTCGIRSTSAARWTRCGTASRCSVCGESCRWLSSIPPWSSTPTFWPVTPPTACGSCGSCSTRFTTSTASIWRRSRPVSTSRCCAGCTSIRAWRGFNPCRHSLD